MMNVKKKFIVAAVLVCMVLVLAGCGNGEPVAYSAPKGAPYEGLYEVDRMNYSQSYSYSKGVDEFIVKMNWKTDDDSIDYAEFTDEYFLEWAYRDGELTEYCEPLKDMSELKNKTYTIKPGEELEIQFDIDNYFDELVPGYYKFVKVLNVVNKDGSSQQAVASFGLDLTN